MINQENALVSIIVPIYGTEKYLKKCVDSIIKQTYRKLEIIWDYLELVLKEPGFQMETI